jgi:hypothetical protein
VICWKFDLISAVRRERVPQAEWCSRAGSVWISIESAWESFCVSLRRGLAKFGEEVEGFSLKGVTKGIIPLNGITDLE